MEYRILPWGDRYSIQKKTWLGWQWVSDYSGYDPKDQLLFWTSAAAQKWIERQRQSRLMQVE